MKKNLTTIAQESCELYWAIPGDNIPRNSSYTAIYHPSRKLPLLDEPDMRDTAEEVGANL